MNSKKLILSILISSVANSAFAVEIIKTDDYSLNVGGRIEAVAANEKNKIKDWSAARVNIGGEAKINDRFSGIGFFESEFTAKKNKNRYVWAGLKTNIADGSLKTIYGKTDGAMGIVRDIVGIQAWYGAVSTSMDGINNRNPNSLLAHYDSGKGTQIKEYYSKGAEYKHKISKNEEKTKFFNEYSIAASQVIGDSGFTAGVGYGQKDKGKVKHASEFDLSLGYKIGNAYFAGLYTQQKLKGLTGNGFDLVAEYKFNDTFKSTIGYGEIRFKNGKEKSAANVDLTAQWAANLNSSQPSAGARYLNLK